MAGQGSPIHIRTATLADEDAVLALLEELFEPPGRRARGYTLERGREGFRYAVEHPAADVLLAVEGAQVLGLATVYRDYFSIRDGWRCWLQDLVVARRRRSEGIGKALLDAATEWARGNGCTHLDLSSGSGRKDAHRFYVREGMTQSYTFRRQID